MSGTTEYKVSIRVSHPTARAEEIAARVGLKSRIVQSVGDERETRNGTKLEGTYQRTYVLFDLKEFEGVTGVEGTLKIVLETIADTRSYLSELVETGGRVEFSIGIFCSENTGLEIDAELVRTLASARMGLLLDVYP